MNAIIDLALLALIAIIAWNVLSLLVTLLVWGVALLHQAITRR